MSDISVNVTSAGAANVAVSNGSAVTATVGNGGAVNVALGTISPGNATVVSGTVVVNSTQTLSAGASAFVKNAGSVYAAKLDFGIPTGQSTTVSVGNTTTLAAGSNATVTGTSNGSTLTLAFGIPAGASGSNGINGTNGLNGVTPSFSIGTVTTGAAGSSATVTATSSNAGANVLLDFTIPRGADGSNGSGSGNLTLSDATPSALGTAAAGTSNSASRADHTHQLPTIAYGNLSDVPTNFPTNTSLVSGISSYSLANHAHNYVTGLNNLAGNVTLAAGSNVTLSANGSTLTISASGGGGGGGSVSYDYATPAALGKSSPGNSSLLYVTTDDNRFWRWTSGGVFCEVGPGSVSTTSDADQYFANVSLLLHMNGSNGSSTFVDKSSYAHSVTPVSNAAISTTQSRFGGSSLYVDGNYLELPDHSSFDFGTGEWTIEFWAYCTNQTRQNPAYLGTFTSFLDGAGSFDLQWDTQFYPNKFAIYWYPDNPLFATTQTFSSDQWRHVALVRDQNTIRLYIDGVQHGSASVSSARTLDLTSGGGAFIGANMAGSNGLMNDYIDDLRITKGVCRYPNGTTFTPPSAAFPDA